MIWTGALATQKEARTPSGPVRYRDAGRGEPIVFVHGLAVNGSLWRDTAERLSASCRVIVPDWPLGAHTAPMSSDADLGPTGIADLVFSFLDALGLERATLVGNDSGGAICQIAVTRRPERVDRLILTNCDAFESFPPLAFRYLVWGAKSLPGFVTVLGQTLRLRFVQRLPIAFGDLTRRPIPDEILDDWVRPLAASGVRRDLTKFLRGISPRLTMEAAKRFPDYRGPVLVVWAHEDRYFLVEHARRMCALFRNAKLETIADAQTFVSMDQPELLAARIASFLGESDRVAAISSGRSG